MVSIKGGLVAILLGAGVVRAVALLTPEVSRFDELSLFQMKKVGLELSVADQYAQRFHPHFVSWLYKKGVSPEIANSYDPRFSEGSIVAFHKKGVSPEKANTIDERLGTHKITTAIYSGVPIETLNAYKPRKGDDTMTDVCIECYRPSGYPTVITAATTFNTMVALRIPPDIANSYHQSFSTYGVIQMFFNGIKPGEANKFGRLNEQYRTDIGGDNIIGYKRRGIPYKTIRQRAMNLQPINL